MSDKIKFILSGLWSFLKPLIKVLLSEAGAVLAKSATEAVGIVAETMGDADGAAKREEAFKRIEADLKRQGVQLGASVINAAIEAAVVKLKEEVQ